jgi:hypothetical protein
LQLLELLTLWSATHLRLRRRGPERDAGASARDRGCIGCAARNIQQAPHRHATLPHAVLVQRQAVQYRPACTQHCVERAELVFPAVCVASFNCFGLVFLQP